MFCDTRGRDAGGPAIRPRSAPLPLPFQPPAMDRPPIPPFWIAVQILIIICVLISAVIVIVKL